MNLTGSLPLGVAAGLFAAAASAVSYLVSRHYGSRAPGGSLRLLVQAHAVMGLASLPIVALVAPASWPPTLAWLWPLAGSMGFYVVGQAGVFAALRRIAASRVAPLLGLKLVMLAAIVSLSPGGHLDGRQWAAVVASVVAAGMLQRGGPIGLSPLAIILVTCLGFACSDLFIIGLIDALEPSTDRAGLPISRLGAGALAMAITYVACGAVAAAVLMIWPSLRPRDRHEQLGACQYAAAWLSGMVALYACFGLVGVVFGNVLQATRGVMAVGLGAWLARAGWHDLEERVDRGTFIRRVLASLLMVAAIAVYVMDWACS
jgi:drug/metabolite transporter (DMT)-like permease